MALHRPSHQCPGHTPRGHYPHGSAQVPSSESSCFGVCACPRRVRHADALATGNGDHRTASATSRVLSLPLEHAVARAGREAGASGCRHEPRRDSCGRAAHRDRHQRPAAAARVAVAARPMPQSCPLARRGEALPRADTLPSSAAHKRHNTYPELWHARSAALSFLAPRLAASSEPRQSSSYASCCRRPPAASTRRGSPHGSRGGLHASQSPQRSPERTFAASA